MGSLRQARQSARRSADCMLGGVTGRAWPQRVSLEARKWKVSASRYQRSHLVRARGWVGLRVRVRVRVRVS